MMRLYFNTVTGLGTRASPYRAAMADYCTANGIGYGGDDGRVDVRTTAGWMIIWADVTPAQHTQIVAIAGVTWVPFENASAQPLDFRTAAVGDLSPARRANVATILENNHVPATDLTAALQAPLRAIVSRIVRRIRVRRGTQLMFANYTLADSQDFTEPLDNLLSLLSATKRTTAFSRLSAVGYDTGLLSVVESVRQSLIRLSSQDVPFQANQWD